MTITRRSPLVRRAPTVALTAGFALLAGCNPIGGGTGPSELQINAPDGTLDADTGEVFGCIRSGLTASLFFENGTAADFTQRVNWSVAEVDRPILDISNFVSTNTSTQPGGVLTPGSLADDEAPRVVRITAEFGGLTDFIDITVNPEPTLTLMQRNIGTNLPEALPAGTVVGNPDVSSVLRMAPQTSIDFLATATLGGRPLRIDNAAQWSFGNDSAGNPITVMTDPADNATVVATIGQDGVLTATSTAAGTLTPRATFTPACRQTLSAQVTVSPIRSIRLVPEFGDQALIVPNTERYFVMAGFDADGLEQDVSPFSSLTSSDPAVANFIGSLLGIPNLLSSVAAGGPVTLTVTTPTIAALEAPAVPPPRNAPTIPQTVVAGELQRIEIAPATATAVTGSSTVCPLRVTGVYAGDVRQDITRRVNFTASDSTIAIVSSVPLTAGQLGSAGLTPGTTTITATVPSSTATPFTATMTFTSVAPGGAESCDLTPVVPAP